MEKVSNKLKKLESLIGNTPTLRIYCEVSGKILPIIAKYEAVNFTGSIKDRMAFEILKGAYLVGNIQPGDTIVEATSGNTGISLAAIGAFLGHPVHIYMPKWLSEERKKLLRFYGAKLIEIGEKEGGFLHCIELAAKKASKKGFYGPKQFENSWNPCAHTKTTAPELEKALLDNDLGLLDVFVAGVGTGGTVMGVYHHFAPKLPDFKAIPVLPIKNEDGAHRIEGIGDSFIPKILDLAVLGPVIRISDEDAIRTAQKLNKIGLSVGISSGANIFAALSCADKSPESLNIATVLCDGNSKYLSTDLCSEMPAKDNDSVKILDFEIIS